MLLEALEIRERISQIKKEIFLIEQKLVESNSVIEQSYILQSV